ncbi:hypothetical protein [Cupriavidus necator]|uniref:hypothetical protein n=1 Tax=Cupriavidus necator TaxID=106590 RepID=UPI0018AFFEE9|nr:hypothetical protein [Cupriavidus necator]
MAGHRLPVTRSATMGMVFEQRFKVAGIGQFAQGRPEQVALAGHRWIVEAQVDRVVAPRLEVDTVSARKRSVRRRHP